MSQLREVRRRIQSVKNTQQVTRAMKMVAAAKLRRAQEAALQARPYSIHMEKIINALLRSEKKTDSPLLLPGKGDKLHMMVLAGDRGLCGSYNINIFKKAEQIIHEHENNIEITAIGKKTVDFIKKLKPPIIKEVIHIDDLDRKTVSKELSDYLVQRFLDGYCNKVIVVHAEFESIVTQPVVTKQLLPFLSSPDEDRHSLPTLFHPSIQDIFGQLLPRYLLTQIHHAILESIAGVFGARMTAMDMATRNAGDLIGSLTLDYNRARQAAITRELIEIVSGADALND